MTPAPIALLEQAADCGLRLSFEPPDTLTVEPARLCTPEFADVLRAHKVALLALLRLPFVMVYSQALEGTIFFCQDANTKEALVKAGAESWSIYTRDELQILVTQNRIAPLTAAELRKVHEIKRAFDGRITK
jgi:antirestriction protein